MSFRFIEEKDKEQTKSAKRSLHDKPTIKEVPVSGGGDDDDDTTINTGTEKTRNDNLKKTKF